MEYKLEGKKCENKISGTGSRQYNSRIVMHHMELATNDNYLPFFYFRFVFIKEETKSDLFVWNLSSTMFSVHSHALIMLVIRVKCTIEWIPVFCCCFFLLTHKHIKVIYVAWNRKKQAHIKLSECTWALFGTLFKMLLWS